MAFERSKQIARSFKRELIVYQRVLRDDRTPTAAKLFLGLAIGYLCMPFDLIPDFIPVIGHLDDAIIVPAWFLPRFALCHARSFHSTENRSFANKLFCHDHSDFTPTI